MAGEGATLGGFGAGGPFGNQPQGASLATFGQGKPANTPLSPVERAADFEDTTISPEMKARYLQQQIKDNGLSWQRGLIKAMIPGTVGALAGAAAGTLAGGPLGAVGGFVAGMGANALGSGATHYLMHRDPLLAATEGGLNAVLHGLGGARAAAHGNQIRQGPLKTELPLQQRATADYLQKLAAHPAAARAAAEAQAKDVADTVKGVVAPWADVPSDARGIAEMVGPGWTKVQAAYDQSLKEAVASARGQTVNVPATVAQDLRVNTKGLVEMSRALTNPQADLVRVDAADLLTGMVGKSRRAPRAYQAAARALDEAGIGDPAARATYYNAASFREFVRRNRIVENGVFYPDRVQHGIAGMQSRRYGDIAQTEMYPALERSRPLERPTAPVFDSPITKAGESSHVGEVAGRTGAHAAGMPWTAGHAVGRLIGKITPGVPELQAPPFSRLGGPSSYGQPLAMPQRALVNAEGAGIGLAARGVGAVGTKEGWDYIQEHLFEPRYQEDKPAPKPSPLRPATIDTEEEER